MNIEYLDWDSKFFNQRVGKVIFNDKSDLKNFNELNYDVLYIFSDQKLISSNPNLFLADTKITFECPINNDEANIEYEIYTGDVTKELLDLAISSGWSSRFKLDKRFEPLFEKLYTQWIVNSVNGQIADAVIVIRANKIIIGFVTVKLKGELGQIGLIAVNENMRGKGLGRQLMKAAHHWYFKNNAKVARVVTQELNKGAMNLYTNFGYTIKSKEFIYHLWKK